MIVTFTSWAAVAQDGPAEEDWQLERQEWTWQVDPADAITIGNPLGDLAVRVHDRAEVYLLANTQRHRDDPRALEVTADKMTGKLEVMVGFEGEETGEEPSSWVPRRADITVFVPEDATSTFSTHQGTLEIRGTRGPVEARSFSGDIRLRIFGAVSASTDHGDVLAQFLRTDGLRPSEITTSSGSIRVEMPQGGAAEVEIETRGEITSDYSMEIDRVAGTLLKQAQISAGSNGPRLSLTSYQGAIQFVESLVPAQTDKEQNDDE